MTASRTLVFAAVLAGFVAFALPARADQTATSTISQLKVLERSDSRYKLFHGALWLQVDKATHNYRWGGKHCNNAGLSDVSLRMLFDAFREKDSIAVEYTAVKYKDQTSRCVTGFTVTR
jgi:hypothetical protein